MSFLIDVQRAYIPIIPKTSERWTAVYKSVIREDWLSFERAAAISIEKRGSAVR